jgi:peptidoglycan/LPS O-acetylase OafA/YrhL
MHFNNFHFLRFFAAVLVIYGHTYPLAGYGNLDDIQRITGGLFPSAHIGVCIFFSISGYLIAKSLESSKKYFHFFLKRLIRIMPGLIAAVLFTVFVLGPFCTTLPLKQYFSDAATYDYLKVIKLFPQYPDSLPGVFKSLPITLVNGSLWTLAYEVTCYGLLMGAHMLFRKHLKIFLLIAFAAVWGSYFYWNTSLSAHPVPLRFIHLNLYDLLDFGLYFLVGSLLYYYQDLISYRWVWLLLSFLVFMLSFVLSSKLAIIPLDSIVWVRYVFLPYAVLSLGFKKGLLNKFGNYGDISYGLYIYAFPVQQMILSFTGPENISIAMLFVTALVLILPLAWVSWKFIEEPVLKLKGGLK